MPLPHAKTLAGLRQVAQLFQRQAGAWRQSRYVKSSSPAESARFGESIALSLDGQSMAVGAVNDHSAVAGIGDGTGAVYLY